MKIRGIVIGLACLLAASFCEEPAQKPTDTIVKKGDQAGTELMKCELTNPDEGYQSLQWMFKAKGATDFAEICIVGKAGEAGLCKDKETLYALSTTKYNLNAGTDPVKMDHAGEYQCVITPPDPETDTPSADELTARLTVVDTIEMSDLTLKPSESQKLTCTVNYDTDGQEPTIKIKEDNTDLTDVQQGTPADNDGKTLKVKTAEAQLHNDGSEQSTKTYTCYIGEKDTISVTATVTFTESKFEMAPEDAVALNSEETDIGFTCRVKTGFARLDWQFKDDATAICTGYETPEEDETSGCTENVKETYELKTDDSKFDLTVKKVNSDTFGKYTCKVGEEERHAELIVIKENPGCERKREDDTDMLVCTASYKGNKQPILVAREKDSKADLATDAKPSDADDEGWIPLSLTYEMEDTTKTYTCSVLNGEEVLADCDSGASTLTSRVYQSFLIAMAIAYFLVKN